MNKIARLAPAERAFLCASEERGGAPPQAQRPFQSLRRGGRSAATGRTSTDSVSQALLSRPREKQMQIDPVILRATAHTSRRGDLRLGRQAPQISVAAVEEYERRQ